mgnify:CR=1 FL=1
MAAAKQGGERRLGGAIAYSFSQDVPEAKWVYLSSLASNSADYHKEIGEYLKKYPDTKLAFQPGTFQIKLGVEALKDLYDVTEIFFCNKEEAQMAIKELSDLKAKKEGLGKYDKGNAIITIISGAGGIDAEDFSAMLMHMYMKFCETRGFGVSFVHQNENLRFFPARFQASE